MTNAKDTPAKAFAPAAARNRQPIREVLQRVLPTKGLVLEIASGTGQHAEYFAAGLPGLRWQPSDVSARALASIDARAIESARSNFLRPVQLDVTRLPWPVSHADAVLCINLIHVAPWEAAIALFAGAEKLLGRGRVLVTYGPYRLHGCTAPSNEAFDQSLRQQNPQWGIREVDDLQEAARAHGFVLTETAQMPANNLLLVWTQTPAHGAG